MTYQPGDRVLYRHHGGWSGGATYFAVAIVIRVYRTRAAIALYDGRARRVIEKRVALTSLVPRTTESRIDNDLRAFQEALR